MYESLKLVARPRTTTGKGAAGRMRREGIIPGIYYRSDEDPIPLEFNLRDVQTILAKHPPLFTVSWGDGEGEMRECMVRDVQHHPVSQVPMHIDLMGVTHGVKLEATVPLKLTGSPVGVRISGGIVQQNIMDVDIRCLPKDIPEALEVDVSDLDIGDSIHLADLQFEGIEWVTSPDRTVASVVAPSIIRVVAEEVEEEAEAAEEEAGAETEAKTEDKGDEE